MCVSGMSIENVGQGKKVRNWFLVDYLYNPSTTTMTKSFLGMDIYIFIYRENYRKYTQYNYV